LIEGPLVRESVSLQQYREVYKIHRHPEPKMPEGGPGEGKPELTEHLFRQE